MVGRRRFAVLLGIYNIMTQQWIRSARSGLFIPVTEMAPVRKATMTSYAGIAKQAEALQQLFTKIKRPLSKELAALCKSATVLAEKWETKKTAELPPATLWAALSLHRVANAVLRLDGHARAEEIIGKLSDGDISMMGHERTVARDMFWEVEFWHFLLRVNLTADLLDPPDIIWDKDGQKTAIACKRIYSEKHIQNVLSEAVHQIEAAGGLGIAAFQLEDARIPEKSTLKNVTQDEASQILQGINLDFLHDHERHFLKYFTKDRLSAALVATSCFAIIDNLYVNTQWTVWTHPQLPEEHKQRVLELHAALVAGTSEAS